ncbi:DUF317 domain-containing protein [Streptomyces caniferus]|uniref:DUF317 domain-containing protein n=1 Tax=Streptomyces caniferus TaxID=285557 RepID=UPI0037FCEF37
MLEELLGNLADGDVQDAPLGAPADEKAVTAATQPLSDAGWKHTVDGRWIRWTSPAGDAGVQFDAFAAQHPQQSLATWTVWAGPGPDRPTWILTASPHTPSSLLAGLCENLVHGVGTRQKHPAGHERKTPLGTTPLATPAVVATPTASRSR